MSCAAAKGRGCFRVDKELAKVRQELEALKLRPSPPQHEDVGRHAELLKQVLARGAVRMRGAGREEALSFFGVAHEVEG